MIKKYRQWMFLSLFICFPFYCSGTEGVSILLAPRPGLISEKVGVYQQICELIFQDTFYEPIFEILPLEKALKMVKEGEADITIDYVKTQPNTSLLYSEHSFLQESIELLCSRQDLFKCGNSLDELKDSAVGVYFSYDFEKDLPTQVERLEHRDLFGAMRMLRNGKLLALIDFSRDIQYVAQDNFIPFSEFFRRKLGERATYFVFSDTSKGRKLKHLFDARVQVLIQNGSLNELFKQYDLKP